MTLALPAVSKRSTDASVASSSKTKTTTPSDAEQKAQDEIKLLKAQLNTAQRRQKSPQDQLGMNLSAFLSHRHRQGALTTFNVESINVAKPHKGASLANPNKKARKYKALEFGSDED